MRHLPYALLYQDYHDGPADIATLKRHGVTDVRAFEVPQDVIGGYVFVFYETGTRNAPAVLSLINAVKAGWLPPEAD